MPVRRREIFPKEGNKWDLIVSRGRGFCFVCDLPIKSKEKSVCIGKDKYKNELHRHKKCDALSKKWKIKFGEQN